ncbi:hypothetical protein PHYBLDRAFT_171896 [Phycomyces blakesleeanus NRRL 1555(-)]|uniref:Uncharacterized protein n=1 Tax=Phycomyces blakesleeanus (strain ATCC 8743b / DSM 1359 / FGSC 10004 / NBRC 33097 / NRRL 1555) TaxID=763407 RepID=A0A162NI37_PHYB8|nr:hypothetical protein PHYBLDRAFT_171896 [Phycomyces blakesleeanus NRRL 1555(-)]OAD69874.1 hypothetical protein PHYBLDRAFT_171896 [Phycomyces blakesleeanus NRRL 1555(-)]|eukprot:XP_018287914.1 hypothetical protein PHYBLDRAFT_171896 [Phycomyces blakesleeanus NRRL 1555(-)]
MLGKGLVYRLIFESLEHFGFINVFDKNCIYPRNSSGSPSPDIPSLLFLVQLDNTSLDEVCIGFLRRYLVNVPEDIQNVLVQVTLEVLFSLISECQRINLHLIDRLTILSSTSISVWLVVCSLITMVLKMCSVRHFRRDLK